MGHPNAPQASTCNQPCRETRPPHPSATDDSLKDALGAIWVLGLELVEEELKPHLNTVLSCIQDQNGGGAEQVLVSGVLPILAVSLRHRGAPTLLTAKLVAELAREPQLQEVLLHHGAVPRLVAVLLRFPAEEPLEDACLLALCNVSGMGLAEEAGLVWERGVSTRPGESLFHAVSPRTCGFTVSHIQVRVSQWAGQSLVSVDVSQRYSSSCWSLCGKTGTTSQFPLSSPGRDSKTWKNSVLH